ncbi:MAG: exopolysaccharide biosynthesis protein [Rhodovibrionaceae bacterium]
MTQRNEAPQKNDGEEHSLSAVLDRLKQAGDGDGEVGVNDVLDIFSDRSLGVLLSLFGLLAAIPVIGAIPGMSILTGTLILLAIARSTFGRGALHLPAALDAKKIDRGKFQAAIDKTRPVVEKIDKVLKPRVLYIVEGRGQRLLLSLAAALLAISMYPLALVPWGVQAPAAGIVAFGLALMARDGLFAAFGYALAGLTLYLVLVFV